MFRPLYRKRECSRLVKFDLVLIPRVSKTAMADKFVSYASVVPDDLSEVSGLSMSSNKLLNLSQARGLVAKALEDDTKNV